jgi:hypothetical protein
MQPMNRTLTRSAAAIALFLVCVFVPNRSQLLAEQGSTVDVLDWTIGSWTGTRRATDGTPDASITLFVHRLPENLGQFERAHVNLRPRPYVGFAVRTRGPGSGRWVMTYGNSNRDTLASLDGVIEGDVSSWTSANSGTARRSRLVFERPAPDSWRRTQSISDDGGTTWRVLFVDDLIRVR